MSLGAQRGQILLLIIRGGMRLVSIGLGIGLLLALGVNSLLEFFIHGWTVGKASTYLGAPALLMAITFLASYLPARRATKIDPVAALRCE